MSARRFLLALVCALAVVVLAPAASAQAPPSVPRAAAAIVVDARDGVAMFRKSADQRRPIASTTKLMTALLALERSELDDVFTAPRYRANPAESRIYLRAGERMRMEDLLEALLLESANDAAVTIAAGVSGSTPAFVRLMNRRAEQLGLRSTSYANPIGLDEPGNASTARDLARLSVRLLRNPVFGRIVDMPSAVLESGSRRRVVENRNELVRRHEFVDGIKTGYTLGAGNVLVGAARGRGDAAVISVVLGEPSEAARDADTLALLRWGLRRFRQARALDPDVAVARPEIRHRDERAELIPREALTVTLRRGQRLRRVVDAPRELDGPIAPGTRVGSVAILRDGERIARTDLLTAAEVPGAGPLRVITATLGPALSVLLGLAILGASVIILLRVRRASRRPAGRGRVAR